MRLASLIYLGLSQAVIFDANIKPTTTRCFSEELAANVLFVVEAHSKTQPLPIQVTVLMVDEGKGSQPETYFNDTSAGTITTAFTVPKRGSVDVCIRNPSREKSLQAGLRLASGALAKDFSRIATKQHLDPAVAELRSVESKSSLVIKTPPDMLQDYRVKQMFLLGAEKGSRNDATTTHKRVISLAAVNVGVIVICNVVSIVILRSFFRAKKII